MIPFPHSHPFPTKHQSDLGPNFSFFGPHIWPQDPRASEILEAARSMQHTLMGSAEIPQLYWKEAIYQEAVGSHGKSVGYICGLYLWVTW